MNSAAPTKGYAIVSNPFSGAADAWKAFNRIPSAVLLEFNTGKFGTDWLIVTFPEPRIIRGWQLQFFLQTSAFSLEIEGKHDGAWTRIVESASTSPVNSGYFGAVTTPKECTAVRIRTNSTSDVWTCQFFDVVPLIPVTMTNGSTLANTGVELLTSPTNNTLHERFTRQNTAGTHGTIDWYYNGGVWRSNRGMPSTKDQRRFEIHFSVPKTVSGFSIGGFSYNASYCYANCLRIEGRESESDFWQLLDEVEYDPAGRRTRCFDFPVNRTFGQLRITVQDVTRSTGASNSASVYLPPMQVWGK